MKPAPDFDLDELIAIMQATTADSEAPRGVTVRELCAELGWGEDRVRKALRRLADEGRLEIVLRRITTLNGVVSTVRAYRLVDER